MAVFVIECPNCHTGNPEGARFCRECAQPLGAERVCPQCGHVNSLDSKFCNQCAHPFAEEPLAPTPGIPPSLPASPSAEATSFTESRHRFKKLSGGGGRRFLTQKLARLGFSDGFKHWCGVLVLYMIALIVNLIIAIPFFLYPPSEYQASVLQGFTLDDAWIHLCYVDNLTQHGGFFYNTGIWEAGMTSWGWVLVLSPAYLVGHLGLNIDPGIVVKLTSLLLSGIITLLVFILARNITRNRLIAVIIALVVAVEATFAYHRISGMEGSLVVAAILGTTLACLYHRYLLTGLLLALCFLARPELGLFVGCVLLVLAIKSLYENENRGLLGIGKDETKPTSIEQQNHAGEPVPFTLAPWLKAALKICVPPALVLLIWLFYNQMVNGTWFPNTYLAFLQKRLFNRLPLRPSFEP